MIIIFLCVSFLSLSFFLIVMGFSLYLYHCVFGRDMHIDGYSAETVRANDIVVFLYFTSVHFMLKSTNVVSASTNLLERIEKKILAMSS